MHESVLMSKPVSSLILLILFVKCLWALILQPRGIPLPLGGNSLHEVSTLIPEQVFRTKPLCGAPPEQMHPPDSFPRFLLALVPSQGHRASRKALVGLQLPWSQREPAGQQFPASYHSLLALSELIISYLFP